MICAENPFYTVQFIYCRELGSNTHPAQTFVRYDEPLGQHALLVVNEIVLIMCWESIVFLL
jgi:hypothetical protein